MAADLVSECFVPNGGGGGIGSSRAFGGQEIIEFGFVIGTFPGKEIEDIERQGGDLGSGHHVDLGFHSLGAKVELTGGRFLAVLFHVITGAIVEGAAGADCGAHGFFAHAGAIVTHVALHHEIELGLHLGDTKRTGQHAVGAGHAARLGRGVDLAFVVLLDGICGADLGAGGILAVHADNGGGLDASGAVDVLKMNHGMTTMRLAFRAGLHTGLAANAARRVEKELHLLRVRRILGEILNHGVLGLRDGGVDFFHATGADLELWYFGDRVKCSIG